MYGSLQYNSYLSLLINHSWIGNFATSADSVRFGVSTLIIIIRCVTNFHFVCEIIFGGNVEKNIYIFWRIARKHWGMECLFQGVYPKVQYKKKFIAFICVSISQLYDINFYGVIRMLDTNQNDIEAQCRYLSIWKTKNCLAFCEEKNTVNYVEYETKNPESMAIHKLEIIDRANC